MADDDQTEAAEAKLDASYKPDVATLDGGEADFAKALGFGSDGNEGAETNAADDAPPVVPSRPSAALRESPELDDADPADGDDALDLATAASPHAPSTPDADDLDAAEDPDAADASGIDYEEIRPRAAAEGMQETLQARADELMTREEIATTVQAAATAGAATTPDHDATVARLQKELEATQSELADCDRALSQAWSEADELRSQLEAATAGAGGSATLAASDEKEIEELRSEIDMVSVERDQLIDELASASGRLVDVEREKEQLRASLRAARGALVPLPEGERALRAEVIGLRGRLDEANEENVRLASEVASVATELSIAAARLEDRQHEIDFHVERAADFQAQTEAKEAERAEAVRRHRDAVALATRLQAENNELRSAQAALEETLQARDLEISAREEQLRVTRDGLAARDAQRIDLKQALDRERGRIADLEAELERAGIEHGVLRDKVARRESRIATLTATLEQIEEAMGQRLHLTAPGRPVPPRTDGTRPRSSLTATTAPSTVPERGSESAPTRVSPAAPAPARVTTREDALEEAVPATGSAAFEDTTETLDPEPVEDSRPTDEPDRLEEPALAEATEPVLKFAPAEATEPVLKSPAAAREPIEESAPAPAAAPESVEQEIERLTPEDEEEPPTEPPRLLSTPPALPTILGRWRDERINSMDDIGAPTVADFLATRLVQHMDGADSGAVYLRSLAGSLPDAEARLVAALGARGVEGIRLDVLETDPARAELRRQHLERVGLGEASEIRIGDLDDWDTEAPCHGILLADVLHAQERTDAILDRLASTVDRGAMVLFAGRIGAGPMRLSPASLLRLRELWELIPERLAACAGLGTPPFDGDDGGVPPASVDPGVALLSRFDAVALAGFGHLADLVVGASRGNALSEDDVEALQLLDSVTALDESRGLTESLPPRHGIGVFASKSGAAPEIFGQGWPALDEA